MLKKSLLFLLFVLFTLNAFPLIAKAAGSGVSFSATVVERKPTDTINDFDLSALNPLAADQSPELDNPQVKGVNTGAKSSIFSIKDNSTLPMAILYSMVLIIALVYASLRIKLAKIKRRIFISAKKEVVDNYGNDWVVSENAGLASGAK